MTGWESAPLPTDATTSLDSFRAQFGGVYEHSAWVAEAVWQAWDEPGARHFGELADAMSKAVDSAAEETQLELLRSHPELAGKAALSGDVTKSSASEQRGAGLDQCSPEELAEIRRLNREYHARFGFPFIIAVAEMTRTEIIAAMRQRLERSAATEVAEAIRQVHKIAQHRLRAIASQ